MFEVTRAWLRSPVRTGAIAASGGRLARSVAREAFRGDPRVVIEVGAGSGAITKALAAEAHAHDAELLALDINAELLRHAPLAGRRVRADASHLPVRRADVVVSGIPFGILPEPEARRILRALAEVAPRIVLFQYTERRMRVVQEAFPGARVVDVVLANLPPAQVVASPVAWRLPA